MVRRALVLIPLLGQLVACGGERSAIGTADAPSSSDESPPPLASADAGADAAAAPAPAGDAGPAAKGEQAPAAEPKPDPSTVKVALDRTGQSTDIEKAPLGLRFEVVEQGPELPWAIAIVNRGSEPVRVAYDPRLLRLEVDPPAPPEEPAVKGKRPKPKAKPKKVECELPAGIRPTKVDGKMVLEFAPGEGVVETFDPRLYCVPVDGKSPLEPGAIVSAHLGWPVKTKTVWKKGQRTEEPVPQTAPFIALPSSASEAPGQPAPKPVKPLQKQPLNAENPAELGVKELLGSPFTLGGEYAPKPPPEGQEPPPLELAFTRGADASSEETATVTVQIKNRSKEPVRVFYRRELLSFEVTGPDGRVTCDPQPDSRAPDRQAFRSLAPGEAITSTSRLIEMCPDDTFARPGLYLAHARFNPFATGSEFDLEALTGTFSSEKPAVIRIRSGELSFLGRRVMQRVKVGQP